jgi:hypothetical protein
MQIGRINTAHPTHTGQLLISAGLISHDKLDEALNLAKKLHMQIGRVLIMCGSIEQLNLESALTAQALVREEAINLEIAVNFLQEASLSKVPLKQVLERSGWKPSGPTVVSDLGELLVSATLLERAELTNAIEELSQMPGQTLGRYLLERRLVRGFDLMNALQALTAVKHDQMKRDGALMSLRTAVASSITFEQAVRKCGGYYVPSQNSVKLGELLSLSGLISDMDLSDAIETALTREMIIGEVLVERNIITRDFLHCVLDVQQMLEQRQVNMHQARELMLAVHSGHGSLQYCFAQLQGFCMAVLGLLVDAGFVTTDDINIARQLGQCNLMDVPEVLYENGYIDKHIVDIARRCQRMTNEGFVTRPQAVQVLANYKVPKGTRPNMEITGVNEILIDPISSGRFSAA